MPYKPSLARRFLGLAEQPYLIYDHALIDSFAHIVDRQSGHADGGQGLHLDARPVARAGRGSDADVAVADLELHVYGGQVQAGQPLFIFDQNG